MGADSAAVGPHLAAAFGDRRWQRATVELLTAVLPDLTYVVRPEAGIDEDAGIPRRRPARSWPPAHDMVRGHRVVSAPGGTAVPVPRTLHLCTDTEVGDPRPPGDRGTGRPAGRDRAVRPAAEHRARRPPARRLPARPGHPRPDPRGARLGDVTLGDPPTNVGMLFVHWPEAGEDHPAAQSPVTTLAGFPTRRDLAERYAGAAAWT